MLSISARVAKPENDDPSLIDPIAIVFEIVVPRTDRSRRIHPRFTAATVWTLLTTSSRPFRQWLDCAPAMFSTFNEP
jgi:hypothetical protein